MRKAEMTKEQKIIGNLLKSGDVVFVGMTEDGKLIADSQKRLARLSKRANKDSLID